MWEILKAIISSVLVSSAGAAASYGIGQAMAPSPPQGGMMQTSGGLASAPPGAGVTAGTARPATSSLGGGLFGAPPSGAPAAPAGTGFGSLPAITGGGFQLPGRRNEKPSGI